MSHFLSLWFKWTWFSTNSSSVRLCVFADDRSSSQQINQSFTPMTGSALRRDGSYLRCKVCGGGSRGGGGGGPGLWGFWSFFRTSGGQTTGEVEEAQSILLSAFVCIGSLLGVWWICSHHALSVLLLVGGFMHEALKRWIPFSVFGRRLLEKSYKDRHWHKVKKRKLWISSCFLF